MQLTVTIVDYAPSELEKLVPPFQIRLLRLLPGPDRPDYWLGELEPPLIWESDNGRVEVTHLVVAARWEGTRIEPNVRDLPIAIAYVIDLSQIGDDTLDFAKCKYVAIGVATETSSSHSAPNAPDTILAGRIAQAFGRGNPTASARKPGVG
jgi:hypothetical protein